MSKRLWICVLILFLCYQFGSLFRTGLVNSADRIPSYASLDLKDSEPDFTNKIVGKTYLRFHYLINATFQISLLVETDDPDRPRVLIQFYPDDTGETGYKSRELYKIPLSNLETDNNYVSTLGIDINEKISDFSIISVSRIGIRGIDCYIGSIELLDPNTYESYLIKIESDPNTHIFEQGWASNNSPESFQVTKTVRDQNFTLPYIYIKGEKVSAPIPPTNDSQTNTSDGDTDEELLFVYNPYLYPGGLYPVRLSNEPDNETGSYFTQGLNQVGGLGLYAGQYGGYSGSLYGMYGLGSYGGIYGGLGMYGGLGQLGGGLYGMYGGLYGSMYGMYGGLYGSMYGMYGGLYGSLGLYGGIYGGLGMYGGLGQLGGGLYGMYGGLYGSMLGGLGLYDGLYSGIGGYNSFEDILLGVALLQNPDVILPLPGDIPIFLSEMFGSI